MDLVSTGRDVLSTAATPLEQADAEARAALHGEVLALYDSLNRSLLRYTTTFGLLTQDGEDVLQEVFLALYRHLLLGRPKDNLQGWLFRTTHNLALKRQLALRAECAALYRADDDLLFDFVDAAPGPEELLLFNERQRRLEAVFLALPDTDRRCLHLRAEGCRYREIASILGISLGSVAASLSRSFQRLERIGA